jgi:hypothetical protein
MGIHFRPIYPFVYHQDSQGVVTPHAGERAAFQEDGGAHARAVMDGKFFNVKNDTSSHKQSVYV